MNDLRPDIFRQRLLIEANTDGETYTPERVKALLLDLAATLELQTYGEPIVHYTSGVGKAENQGYDAFLPLIDSGIALYVWESTQFVSFVLYTCKAFSSEKAIQWVETTLNTTEIESHAF